MVVWVAMVAAALAVAAAVLDLGTAEEAAAAAAKVEVATRAGGAQVATVGSAGVAAPCITPTKRR